MRAARLSPPAPRRATLGSPAGFASTSTFSATRTGSRAAAAVAAASPAAGRSRTTSPARRRCPLLAGRPLTRVRVISRVAARRPSASALATNSSTRRPTSVLPATSSTSSSAVDVVVHHQQALYRTGSIRLSGGSSLVPRVRDQAVRRRGRRERIMNESPVRALFPIVDECVFLDHARVAPLSTRVEERDRALRRRGDARAASALPVLERARRGGSSGVRSAGRCAAAPGRVREEHLRGAVVRRRGARLATGRRGHRCRPRVPLERLSMARAGAARASRPGCSTPGPAGVTVDDVARALDARVRLVALSAVSYGAGERLDLAGDRGACRERGVLFVVDGIQAIGAIELDLARDGMDCIAADGHKWLCAPEGAGFMALSDRLLARLRPVQLGWKSVMNADSYHPYDLSLRRDAAKLEAGSLGLLGAARARRGGRPGARGRCRDDRGALGELTALLAEGCARRGLVLLGTRRAGGRRARASGIVSFVPRRAPERVRQDLWERGVACTVRFGGDPPGAAPLPGPPRRGELLRAPRRRRGGRAMSAARHPSAMTGRFGWLQGYVARAASPVTCTSTRAASRSSSVSRSAARSSTCCATGRCSTTA